MKAFIFDMDGTMIDSMPYHLKTWQKLLEEHGLSMDLPDIQRQLYGTNAEVINRFFGEGRFSESEMEAFADHKEALYRELYSPDIQLVAGLEAFIRATHEAGIPMAIGTSGIMANVEMMLDRCNIRPYFSAIVTADEVKEGKPHPATFLRCAEKLGIQPDACIVFEDVPKGAEAAHRAGMKSVIVTTQHTANEFEHISSVLQCIQDFRHLLPSMF